jgi:hypothetical protein
LYKIWAIQILFGKGWNGRVHSYFLDQISSIWSKANVQAMALGNWQFLYCLPFFKLKLSSIMTMA